LGIRRQPLPVVKELSTHSTSTHIQVPKEELKEINEQSPPPPPPPPPQPQSSPYQQKEKVVKEIIQKIENNNKKETNIEK
jgi:hypothetical protein